MAARGLHFLLGCLATAALLTPPAMAEGDQDCADGWTKFESRCFKFFEEKKTWTESEKSCQSLDANLVSIHSQEENVFVLNLIKKVTGGYPYTWLGGTDVEQEGVWKWSDGSVWDYSHWYMSEPSGGQEDYLMINFGVTFWNDVDNGKKLVYVCAKGLPPRLHLDPSPCR